MEEEGSATLVRGVVEMGSHDNGDEEGGGGGNVKKNKILSKGLSLPKPFLNRVYSLPLRFVKSVSLNSYQIDSAWVYPDDVQNTGNDDRLSS